MLPIIGWRNLNTDDGILFQMPSIGMVKGISTGNESVSSALTASVGSPMTSTLSSPSRHLRKPAKVDVYFGSSKTTTESAMLEESGIVIFPEDHVTFFPEPKLGVGSRIMVARAPDIMVEINGITTIYRTWASTVEEFLHERQMDIGPYDNISLPLQTEIKPGLNLTIKRADESVFTESVVLPFEVTIQDDPWLPDGKVKIKEQGDDGERQKIWRIVRKNGLEIGRILASEQVVRQPQRRLVLRGTKPVEFDEPYYDWILEAADKYGADPDAMFRVMMCESGGDPYALSPSEKYHGLFQYDDLTWSVSGWGDWDIFDPYAQINAAAKAWPSRYTKWPNTSRICGDLGKR